jgi:acyl-CoA synthetase (AMP-forming)/AMP-acid ligase II
MLIANIGDVLARRAQRTPDLEAVVDVTSGRRMSFQELDRRANQVAHATAGLGVVPGERVGLLLPNGPEFVECFYGLAKMGAIVVLLNWRLVADELEYLLVDSGTTTLIFGVEFASVAHELQQRNSTSVTSWVQVGQGGPGGPGVADVSFAQSYEDLLSAAPSTSPTIASGDDDVLCLCYSSGTTGRPKGAMLTHAGQMWSIMSYLGSSEDFRLGDRYLMVMPLFHLGGLLPMENCIFGGSTIVIMKAFDPNAVWDVIGAEKVTSGLVVPAMLNLMLSVHNTEKHDHSSLKNLWSAAAPLPVTLIEQCEAKGIEMLQVYGLTEAGGPGTILAAEDAHRKIGSSGKAYVLTDVRIARPDGSPCDADEAGEVQIRSKHVMAGYWNNPTATAATVVDGWLHTGDIATMDSEGFVTIRDRIKDMIISGGENVYPAEIENVILSHPGVKEVAVVAQPSPRWGESPLAVVVKSDPTLTAADVLKWCDGKLARFKMPKAVEFVDAVPRNPTGKALKRIMRDQFPGPAPE